MSNPQQPEQRRSSKGGATPQPSRWTEGAGSPGGRYQERPRPRAWHGQGQQGRRKGRRRAAGAAAWPSV